MSLSSDPSLSGVLPVDPDFAQADVGLGEAAGPLAEEDPLGEPGPFGEAGLPALGGPAASAKLLGIR